jgi:DNA-binding MarR family transcriptional regulator
VTQRYEQALRPFGLKGPQFTILQVLARAGELTQGDLGEALVLDSTTLTRTLALMVKQGWIAERRGEDRRERWLSLARAGKALLQRATPAWEKAQAALRRELPREHWEELLRLAGEVAESAVVQGGSK